MSKFVLQARDLKRYYSVKQGLMRPTLEVKALNKVSFDLEPGKTLAVVGESGCGKSTLARLLTLIEPPTDGELIINDKKIEYRHDKNPLHYNDKNIKDIRKYLQIIFQDPYGSLNPRKKIGTILQEPLVVNTDMSKQDRIDKAKSMLSKVGLRAEHFDRYPHMFSGGQRQRVAIARALMLNPKIVIADEPVSALDVSVQAQVLNLLKDLQQEFGLAYVFISHGLSVVKHIADDIMVMYLGRAVEYGENRQLFQSPTHPYTRALLSSTPFVDASLRKQRVNLQGEIPSPYQIPNGCAFHQRCPIAQSKCRLETPQLREVNGRSIACHRAETSVNEIDRLVAAN